MKVVLGSRRKMSQYMLLDSARNIGTRREPNAYVNASMLTQRFLKHLCLLAILFRLTLVAYHLVAWGGGIFHDVVESTGGVG